MVQLRLQIQQVIDLMLSFLRRRESSVEELQIMKLKLDKSTDAQLDDQLSLLLNAIQEPIGRHIWHRGRPTITDSLRCRLVAFVLPNQQRKTLKRYVAL
ncbi:hypothetical protein CBL_11570 [Carabus blaptoides fortunei]